MTPLPDDAKAAARMVTDRLRAAAERREPAAELVPDASGGDPIAYADEQEGEPRATQHRGH